VRRLAAGLTAASLVLLAGPAWAENPVLDADGDADVAASLAEATEVQGVCYGYELFVSDQDTGQWGGTYSASSLGVGQRAVPGPGCSDAVELRAQISYTSAFSEAEDSAAWTLTSTLPSLSIDDVERMGLSAGDLLDDGGSEQVLLNAVLALPRLAAEQAGKPPVVLEPNTAALPSDARPTNTPGSDWLRENAAALGFCVLLVVAGVVMLLLSRRPTYRPL
jgi:hypothetical protein